MEIKRISTNHPQKGDVIWATRSLIHSHCGIYENDNSVYHFAPTDGSKTKEGAVIHRSTLAEFANDSPVVVIELPPEKCYSPEKTIQRACSRLGENAYNPFLNNCDHFATWCKTGEQCSLQVELVKKFVEWLGKCLDNLNEEDTAFEKWIQIFIKIYEIAELISSPEIKRILQYGRTPVPAAGFDPL